MDDLTRIFSQIDAEAKQDILRQEEFQLTPPEGWDDNEDSLGDQTTNDSIEIEIVEAVADAMQELDKGRIRFKNTPPGAENLEKTWS
jgi:hypothetical protein